MVGTTNIRSLQVVRWIARLWAVGVVVLVVVMNLAPDPVTGDLSGTVTLPQAVLALLFPGLYVAGWLLVWWREIAGGALMVVSFPLFAGYIAFVSSAGRFTGAMFVVGTIVIVPGLIFLFAGYRSRNYALGE
ncbi:MAG: hypothetical protein R2844_15550 [Caldilineales bacterium]